MTNGQVYLRHEAGKVVRSGMREGVEGMMRIVGEVES